MRWDLRLSTSQDSLGSSVVCAWPQGQAQIRMLAHAVAVAADIDHVALMHEPVDEGSGHDLLTGGMRGLERSRSWCLLMNLHGARSFDLGAAEINLACTPCSIVPEN